MKLINKKNYRKLVKQAKWYVNVLSGDGGFSNPEVNRVALESMLVGWMHAQPYWEEYERFCMVAIPPKNPRHPRENIFLIAQDQALQAAQDAAGDHYRFKTDDYGKPAKTPSPEYFRLFAKVTRTKDGFTATI